MFNRGAIVALAIKAEGRFWRIGIMDCDVRQGDGTASILIATIGSAGSRCRSKGCACRIARCNNALLFAAQSRADAASRLDPPAFAPRLVSSRLEEVRLSILISKYKNFLTGFVRLLELVPTYRLGHNI